MDEFIKLQREKLASDVEALHKRAGELSEMSQKIQAEMNQLALAEQRIIGKLEQLDEFEKNYLT